jgi:hypothetical protein
LPQRLIDQYVEREIGKLTTPGSAEPSLLNEAELKKTFEHLAELMADSQEREVPIGQLEFCAEMALESGELDTRPGLRNRLSVLCGVAIASDSQSAEKRFMFQHELFYDQFLGYAILRAVQSGNPQTMQKFLAIAEWRSATVAHVVRYAETDLPGLLRSQMELHSSVPRQRARTFGLNLGSVWAELSRVTRRLEDAQISDAVFDALDLTDVECRRVAFRRCEFRELMLPPPGSVHAVTMAECQVETLHVRTAGRPLVHISGLDPNRITQVIEPQSLVEGVHNITEALGRLGAPLAQKTTESAEPSKFAREVDIYLSRIVSRADSIVVFESDLRSAEETSGWQHRPGVDVWKKFIRLLRDAELIDMTQISSAGPSKLKVRFVVSPALIRERDRTDERITGFWTAAEAEH